MRTTIIRAALTATAAATALMLAPASPAAAASSAELTIAQLEAQGFDVKVNRIGSAPLDECDVTDVRNGREQKRFQRIGDDLIEVVVKRTISVSLDCSR
jgi:hypothetical protein